jgi:glutathione S-transferase
MRAPRSERLTIDDHDDPRTCALPRRGGLARMSRARHDAPPGTRVAASPYMEIAGIHLDALAFWRPDQSIENARDLAASFAASAVRGWSGSRVRRLGMRPARMLLLFEKEPCPYSRLVREALSILDVDAHMRPCPEGELAHRAELRSRGGNERIPFLIDPNTGRRMYESRRIVRYLFETYGDGRTPRSLVSPLAVRRSQAASALRGNAGDHKSASRRPDQPLELFGYEAGPHTRLVREQLSRYALPWIARNRAHGSPRRARLASEIGDLEFPVLRDPNTNRIVRESEAIRAYLTVTYAR